MCAPGPQRSVLERGAAIASMHSERSPALNLTSSDTGRQIVELERKAQAAFDSYKDRFPAEVWHCCHSFCFARIVMDPENVVLVRELRDIHRISKKLHKAVDEVTRYIEIRKKGIGGSHVAFVAASREQREQDLGMFTGTERQKALRHLADFIIEVLPFLYAKADAPSGTRCPKRNICTGSICCLLGVSRSFLYARKSIRDPSRASDLELVSLVDTAGVRIRQHRRSGNRTGYSELQVLGEYECGCEEPCFSGVALSRLESEYDAFAALSMALNPRKKENRFLLNAMFCPLSNTTVKQCNRSLSAFFTVSTGFIADIRRLLEKLCSLPSPDDRTLLANSISGHYEHKKHPMNRFSDEVRDRVENHLDMILRADPAGSTDINICRVYSPEVNTQEKLRNLLTKRLDDDQAEEVRMSDCTMRRIVSEYLDARNLRIVFKQTDHNALLTVNLCSMQSFSSTTKESRTNRSWTGCLGIKHHLTQQEAYRMIHRTTRLLMHCGFTSGRSSTRRRRLYEK